MKWELNVLMNNSPLVSIVIPVYQVEKYIANCINSIINQKYKNYELIIVNDGTKDKSIQIAENLLEDTSIDYQIIKQDNKGQALARNVGLEKAKGEWILFLDSDDILSQDALEILIKEAINTNSDIAIGKFIETSNINFLNDNIQLEYNTKVFNSNEIQKEFLYRTTKIHASAVLYKCKLLQANNITFANIKWSEDLEFVWRVIFVIKKAVFVDKYIYLYYRHDNSVMNSTKITSIVEGYNKFKELEKYCKESEISNLILPRWCLGTINSATLMLDYNSWKDLYDKLQMKNAFNVLKSFDDNKVKISSLIGSKFPFLYYKLTKLRKS